MGAELSGVIDERSTVGGLGQAYEAEQDDVVAAVDEPVDVVGQPAGAAKMRGSS
ncbi:hypothetical protein TEK04_09480 [Klenkia sp. LSe6-5]|uniref:Uncharacterized protein n=1 Tax=Klenkia sesuvii TaxID=3103137 RepID=A0ABU8DVR2_9ACTN